MSSEMQLILVETRLRMLLVDEAIAQPIPWHAVADLEDALDFGPRYSPSAWFGATSDRDRQRFRRALVRLIDVGFVVATQGDSGRIERIKLTSAGIEAAERLGEPVAG